MNRAVAAVGSAFFFALAPGTIAGLVPWLITHWEMQPAYLGVEATRVLGALFLVAGLVPLLESFARFALVGRGTPAPVAPPQNLVVSGFYRYVRNPMYIGVLAAIVGQSFLFADVRLLGWGAIVALAFHLFVVFYEEPNLEHAFPDQYARYCANVPRWLPRLTPWKQTP